MEIRNCWGGKVIKTVEGSTLEQANLRGANLSGAELSGANLRGANLRGANLRGADLRGANLRGADLRGAGLYGANLRGANLSGAELGGANLYGADLGGAVINWQSHGLIAEIFRQAAGGDSEKRKVAGLILISPDWCWDTFGELSTDPLFGWAVGVLAGYVQEGDDAPALLRKGM